MKRLLLASLLLASTAHAAPPPPRLRIVVAEAPNQLSARDTTKLREEVRKSYAILGIPIRLYPTRTLTSLSYRSFPALKEAPRVLDEVRHAVRRERLLPPRGMAHVLGPALTDGAGVYSWGLASEYSYGYRNAISISSSVAIRDNGQSGYWLSVNAAIHECAHTMGVEHSIYNSIMHPNALSYVSRGRLPWDIDSAATLRSNYREGMYRNGNF